MSLPQVTAKSWIVYEMKAQKYIYGKRNFKKREIASLTKIMNLITILEILENTQLLHSKIRFTVSKEASYMIGTTADLR
jgi:D-alanyl-D-alanine carboxypeptidase